MLKRLVLIVIVYVSVVVVVRNEVNQSNISNRIRLRIVKFDNAAYTSWPCRI